MPVSVVPTIGVPATTQRPEVAAMDPQLLEILGPPPILEGESLANYNAPQDRARSSVAPADVVEEIWVRDVVDHTWEVFRLRRMKAKVIDARRLMGIKRLLNDLVDYEEQARPAKGWIERNPTVVKRLDKLLAGARYDDQTVTAETIAANLDDIERFDRLTMQAETRRDLVIREMERHRDVVARVREVITDAEFKDVTDKASD